MIYYSFFLKIADLQVQFYCKDKNNANFLKEKYIDFLAKKNITKSTRVVGKIFLVEKNKLKKVRIKGKIFYLPVLPLRENFGRFNDLFRMVMMYLLNRNKGFILHASALIKNGFGYIFTGKENSGKSTIRSLFPELICLGDDSAIIRKINNQFFLFGSPFYQRTNRTYPNQRFPIKAVLELKQANFELVKLLSFPENIKAIFPNLFIIGLNSKIQEKKLALVNCFDFCQENKIFSLFFKKNRSFWPFIEQMTIRNLSNNYNRIIKLINPRVLKKLPEGVIWNLAVGSYDFSGECLVINEKSWQFEFDNQRKIKQVAKIINNPTFFSPHLELINKFRQQNSKKLYEQRIVLMETASGFTIIDGNHRAIAIYQFKKKRKIPILKFLIGRLPEGKTCPLC